MQQQKSIIATLQVLIVFTAVMFCLWQVISSFALIATVGQGWVGLMIWSLALVFSAKALPKQHPVRSAFRAVWNKA